MITTWLGSWNLVKAAWLIFMAYWAISARNLQAVKQQESIQSRLVRSAILVVAGILLFSTRLRVGPLARRFVPETAVVKYAGTFLTFAGVLVAIWARRHIGRYWSSRVTLKVDHKLIKSGPYAYVRHPIYAGLLLAAFGTALVVGEWRGIVGVIFLWIAHWDKARREETVLAQEFGDEFQQYRRHTGSLIPRF